MRFCANALLGQCASEPHGSEAHCPRSALAQKRMAQKRMAQKRMAQKRMAQKRPGTESALYILLMCFVTRNNKSDFQTNSGHMLFPISLPLQLCNACNVFEILSLIPQHFKRPCYPDHSLPGAGGHPKTTNLTRPTYVQNFTTVDPVISEL